MAITDGDARGDREDGRAVHDDSQHERADIRVQEWAAVVSCPACCLSHARLTEEGDDMTPYVRSLFRRC